MDDKTLRLHCDHELDFLPQVDAARIGLAAADGVVTLTGHVATYAKLLVAERPLRRLVGVTDIVSVIGIRHPAPVVTAPVWDEAWSVLS